jgi:hypothetical protein
VEVSIDLHPHSVRVVHAPRKCHQSVFVAHTIAVSFVLPSSPTELRIGHGRFVHLFFGRQSSSADDIADHISSICIESCNDGVLLPGVAADADAHADTEV